MGIQHCEAGEEFCSQCAKERLADDIVHALRGFDSNFMLIGNIKAGELILAIRRLQEEVDRLNSLLIEIGDFAHDKSTGPAVPDALWEIRTMAYQNQ